MSSSQDVSKDELYGFDKNYLKHLNNIRRQLNLDVISDDESCQEDVACPVLPNSPPTITSDDADLYECDTDYLKDLNMIRRQLNFLEISPESDKSQNGTRSVRPKTKSAKSTSSNEVALNYTPPKKKICLREKSGEKTNGFKDIKKLKSSKCKQLCVNFEKKGDASPNGPSQQSSPVLQKHKPLGEGIDNKAFYTLNVPISCEETVKIKPKVTILPPEEHRNRSEESSFTDDSKFLSIEDDSDAKSTPTSSSCSNKLRISPDCDKCDPCLWSLDKKWCTANLDLPRLSTEFYNFPSVVHIAKWDNLITADHKVDVIFSDKLDFRQVKKKYKQIKDRVSAKHGGESRKDVEIEMISSLNNMYHFKTKESDAEESSNDTTVASSEAGKRKKQCGCFSVCFIKKPKNYFS